MHGSKSYRNNWNADFGEPRCRQNEYFDKFKDASKDKTPRQMRRERRKAQKQTKILNLKNYVRNPFVEKERIRRRDDYQHYNSNKSESLEHRDRDTLFGHFSNNELISNERVKNEMPQQFDIRYGPVQYVNRTNNPTPLQVDNARNNFTPQPNYSTPQHINIPRGNFTRSKTVDFNSTDNTRNNCTPENLNSFTEQRSRTPLNRNAFQNDARNQNYSRQRMRTDSWDQRSHTSNVDNMRPRNAIHNNNWQMNHISVKNEPIDHIHHDDPIISNHNNSYNYSPVQPIAAKTPPPLMSLVVPEEIVDSTLLTKTSKKRKRVSVAEEPLPIPPAKEVRKGLNTSSDDVVFIGLRQEVLHLDDSHLQPESNIHISTSTNATQTELPAKKQRKRKKDRNICELCDSIGHTEHQCLMICKNCNEPYHNMRTCPQPNQSQKTLATFLDYCMKQFINTEV